MNQYLHELEDSDLIESKGDKYSINDKGSRFMEILK
ncbi:MAG: winged helix-turn-helix domain-containing protein [Methanobacterium sp.]